MVVHSSKKDKDMGAVTPLTVAAFIFKRIHHLNSYILKCMNTFNLIPHCVIEMQRYS